MRPQVYSDTATWTRRLVAASAIVMLISAGDVLATTNVVVTIFPLADIVRQIGRQQVDVQALLPAGASPHTFEPAPEQLRAIIKADLLVRVGAGLDDWMESLLNAGGGRATVVTVTAGVELLRAPGATRGDPHVWLDPVLVRDHIVPLLVRALVHADAARQADFERAAGEFAAELTRLDRDIAAALAPLPQRAYVSIHPAWRYFAKRYGLEEVAVVEDSPGKEPSAQSVAHIVEQARRHHVRAVLTEPQLSRRMAEVIAAECGATVIDVDPLGGPRVAGRDNYLALMRYNLVAFERALR